MITAGLGIKIAFLAAVAIIWVMILYQIVMTVAGFVHRMRSARLTAGLLARGDPLPAVSVLIPARNEELVIEKTLEAIRALRYPHEKLQIVVIDDGSTDRTAEIVREVAERDPRVRLLSLPKQEQGRGKSHALNVGFRSAGNDFIAVYDADNRPEPDSLEILVRRLQADPGCAAVLGKYRTVNRYRNLLTRFINLESLGFQWIVQAGRCVLFGVGILPGTNFVIRRSVLEQCGGWDERAITEDTELSVRIYENGWKIDFAPEAVSWEEEPERFGVWLRQRTRWVRGNFYVLGKFLLRAWRFKNKFLALQLLYLSLLYYLFLVSILISHLIFLSCSTGLLRVDVPGPYTLVWICACALFVAELHLVSSYEGEHTPARLALAFLMYFTYCQAWLLVVFRALWRQHVVREGSFWEKTVRFGDTQRRPLASATSSGNARGLVKRLLSKLFLLAVLCVPFHSRAGDTVVEVIGGEGRLWDAHWGELYYEGIFETQQDDNFVSFLDLKSGFRLARLAGAKLMLYGKGRAYIDTNQDFWNNKAVIGPGVRLQPFPAYGLYLFAEYLFGRYYGIEGKDPNPYSQSFQGLEAGAAFWQRWGVLPSETEFFLPFTRWRELYWDAIYYERDAHNFIGTLQAKEGIAAFRWGPVAADLYLRFDASLDKNKYYWNNLIEGMIGLRFRPVNEDIDLDVAFEFSGGHYLERDGPYELPYDRDFIGARLEVTYWFGW